MCGSSRLHLAGTVDEVGRASSGRDASVVFAVVVVVVQVAGEVASQAAEADLEVAREGGPPAFFEDRAVQSFDVAVGLRAAGADLGVPDAGGQSGAEGVAAELVAVVGEHAFELPARVLELGGDAAGERGGLLDGRTRRWA